MREASPTAVILRPSVIFGPEDDFLNRFGALARALPALPLFGGGATKLQPVFVGDVALAALAVIGDAQRGRAHLRTRRAGSSDAARNRRADPAHRRAPPRAGSAAVRPGAARRLVDRGRFDAVARPLPQGADDDARPGRAAAPRQRRLGGGDRRRAHAARTRNQRAGDRGGGAVLSLSLPQDRPIRRAPSRLSGATRRNVAYPYSIVIVATLRCYDEACFVTRCALSAKRRCYRLHVAALIRFENESARRQVSPQSHNRLGAS